VGLQKNTIYIPYLSIFALNTDSDRKQIQKVKLKTA